MIIRVRPSWTSVIAPVVGGAASAWLISLATWEQLRTPLLPAISVVAAAVLVRLARGLPFTNADHFSLGDFRSVASKLEANARKLRALIFVCLGALVGLIVFPGLPKLELFPVLPHFEWVPTALNRLLSATLGGTVVYAFTRVIEVVHSDVSLLRLQSRIMETVIASKNAKAFEKQTESSTGTPIAGSAGYGRPLQ